MEGRADGVAFSFCWRCVGEREGRKEGITGVDGWMGCLLTWLDLGFVWRLGGEVSMWWIIRRFNQWVGFKGDNKVHRVPERGALFLFSHTDILANGYELQSSIDV